MTSSPLRKCPKCFQRWPQSADHDLRSFGWLGDLPRHITPSNADAIIHDGARQRFLMLETKLPGEETPAGQLRLLTALAAKPEWDVLVLRGDIDSVDVYRVGASGLGQAHRRTPADVRDWVARWLGADAPEPETRPAGGRPAPFTDAELDEILREAGVPA